MTRLLASVLLLVLAGPPAAAHQGGHEGPPADTALVKRQVSYQVPDVTLRDQRDEPVRLAELLATPAPVLVQFIFTSCATICPVLSATVADLQRRLDARQRDYRLLSISIDPEYDTPARLAEYARRHGAGPDWHFLTGERRTIRKVVAAFDALYRSDNKTYHQPYTFLRATQGSRWLRLEGFASGERLTRELLGLDQAAATAARGR